MGPDPDLLLERRAELDELVAMLEPAAGGGGGIAVLEGPAGIGKSRLLAALRSAAAAREFEVLSARGSELEHEFAFGIARQLFEPALALAGPQGRRNLLTGAAALAEPVLAAIPAEEEPVTDPTHGVLHGLFWLVSNLAERAPLLLAVDDLHWADPASLRFLAYLANRVEDLPVVLAVAMRPSAGAKDAPEDSLVQIRLHRSALVIDPPPLSVRAVRALLEETMERELGEDLVDAAHHATGGNPFLIGELARELAATTGGDRTVDTAAIADLAPARIAAGVVDRLGRLPEQCAAFARSVAVLGDGADAGDAAALARIERDEAARAADELSGEGIFAADRPLRFRHPVLRTSVYRAIPAFERERAHSRAAAILAERGAAEEVVATHLLHAPPQGDATAVSALRSAAAAALRRGAPDAAVEFLDRAIAEPPGPELRGELMGDAARAARLAGDATVVERLRAALEATADVEERAAIAAELGETLSTMGRDPEAAEVLSATLAEARQAGAAAAEVRLLGVLLVLANATGSTRPLVIGEMDHALAEVEGAERPHPVLAAHAAIERAVNRGDADRAVALGRGALEDDLLRLTDADAPPPYLATGALWLSGRHAEAERWLSATLDEARSRGSAIGFALASAFRSMVRWRSGDLDGAEADAEAGMGFGRDAGGWTPVGVPVAAAALLECLVARGDLDRAEALLGGLEGGPIPPDLNLFQHLRLAIAHVHIARGRAAAAMEVLDAVANWEERMEAHTGAWCWWRASAALAERSRGNEERATSLAAEQLDLARAFGAAPLLGQALRTAALVGAVEDPQAALAESVEVLRPSEARLELARSLLAHGAALRRDGSPRDAREPLREAGTIAGRCGAAAIEREALDELVAAGARPRAGSADRDALTPAEARVARLAAEGMTNREIAQALYVTLKTVETHLGRVYRKLEISSRAQLPGRLQDPASAMRG